MRHNSISQLLKSGAQIVASIHHSHGIKATVSIIKLSQRFPHWTPEFWRDALEHSGWNKETRVLGPAVALTGEFSPCRARILIARNVLPLSYSAVRSWIKAEGGDVVASAYVDAACTDPEYLGHRLSILLSFIESWPYFLASDEQDMWADRLCEYLIACQFKEVEAKPACADVDLDACVSRVLANPGFFGHHAITLMWALRFKDRLSSAQLNSALTWSMHAAQTNYVDVEDNIKLDLTISLDPSEAALESALRELLLKGRSNIHLITLADAIAQLWDFTSDAQRCQLLALAHITRPTT